MFSCIHLLAATGDIFHPLLQVDTISTSDEPLPSIEASNALRMARLALLMAATVSTLVYLQNKYLQAAQQGLLYRWDSREVRAFCL